LNWKKAYDKDNQFRRRLYYYYQSIV